MNACLNGWKYAWMNKCNKELFEYTLLLLDLCNNIRTVQLNSEANKTVNAQTHAMNTQYMAFCIL